MQSNELGRRGFLKLSLAALAAPYAAAVVKANAQEPKAKNDRLRIGAVGMRYQGSVIADKAQAFGDIVAVADVDREIAEKAKVQFGGKAEIYEDYRKLLDRADIDVVTIGSPDHWHTKMLIDACRAGKDVYCEKPLTLTVDEGKVIRKVVAETGRVVQVGSWQRSDHRFRLACEMVRSGRIGKLKKVTVVLGKNKTGGPFAESTPPAHLNWNLWQGQTPDVPYVAERCHYTFRWWLEYSGGQMTDWGAHHVDVAQWGIGADRSGPVEVEARAKLPSISGGYNVPVDFQVLYRYADGLTLEVLDEGRNGVLFEGESGRIFVNRGSLTGAPVDDLVKNPLPRESFALYGRDNLDRPPRMGKLDAIVNHMGNFYDCLKTRQAPISDVETQHRTATLCHLANISIRLGRKLRWNPEAEQFVDDPQADSFLKREQRAGFETV